MKEQEAFRFIDVGGEEISPKAGRAARHVVIGEGLPGPDVALCADDEGFEAAARKLPGWPRIEQARADLRRTEELRHSVGEEEIQAQQVRVISHVRRGIADLAAAMNASEEDEEVLLRAAKGRPPLEPPVFDPLLMYDMPFTTSPPLAAPEGTKSLPLPTGTWPVLWWFGWDDRARGVRIFGNAVLCDNPWFFGRFLWLTGFNGLIPLAPVGFDKVVSAAQCF
jgi:hypothetical protein